MNDGRVFPADEKAATIVHAFGDLLRDEEVPIATNCPVAVRNALYRRHGAVCDDGHLLVAQKVAECMHDGRRLLVGGEDPSVGHALGPDAEGLESADDLPRRAFAHGLGDELRAFAGDASVRHVVDELLGRDVLREVAASVRRHEHLRAEARLAFEQDARYAPLGGDGRGEHAGCAAAYDGEFRCDFLLMLGHVAKGWVVFRQD